jgi:hypothetical protein
MANIAECISKKIKVTYNLYKGTSIINVIGFNSDNDVIMETIEQHELYQNPKLTGFVNPFTVDKLWFDEELTGRKIEILT